MIYHKAFPPIKYSHDEVSSPLLFFFFLVNLFFSFQIKSNTIFSL